MAESGKFFSAEDTKIIIERLTEKGVRNLCPMCGKSEFSLADGYMALFTHRNAQGVGQLLGEKTYLPMLAVVCQNCGFTSQHSLSALGLQERFEKGGGNG